MSDDLVKRLRGPVLHAAHAFINEFFGNPGEVKPEITIPANESNSDLVLVKGIKESADCIEELESELSLLKEGLTAAYLSGSFDGRKEAEAKLTRIQGAISQQSLAEGDYGEEGRALAAEIYSILYKEEPNG